MKLINFTNKAFLSVSADRLYIQAMTKAFMKILKDKYLLTIAYNKDFDFGDINVKNLNLFFRISKNKFLFFWLPYIYYFFYIPVFFIFKERYGKNVVCFSNEENIILSLIFWKKILRFRYTICSDWHMLFNNWKDKFIAQNSDYLVTTSNKLKNKLIDLSGIAKEKVLVAYGGIDLDSYKNIDQKEARDKLKLPQDKKIVSYVGLYKTMGMEKGIDTMIESLQYLGDDVIMMFVGGRGNEINEYQEQARSIGVLDRCIFVEMVDFEKVVEYEQASDALSIPYPDKPHFREYGFPMKVYEYMASQRPIIYSRLELAEEVLEDCAFGFGADDAEDFAKQVEFILENNDLAKEKSQKAFDEVSKYTWDKRASGIIDFVKK